MMQMYFLCHFFPFSPVNISTNFDCSGSIREFSLFIAVASINNAFSLLGVGLDTPGCGVNGSELVAWNIILLSVRITKHGPPFSSLSGEIITMKCRASPRAGSKPVTQMKLPRAAFGFGRLMSPSRC